MGGKKHLWILLSIFLLFSQITYAAKLVPYLISPNNSINVTQNEFFNFTAGVRCVGGDCGNITATLDPKAEFCGKNPCCRTAESPCIAGSELLMSADNASKNGPGPDEPNQPNSINPSQCYDGPDAQYMYYPHVENITITNLNRTYFKAGDTVRVDTWIYCWNNLMTSANLAYTNNTENPSFRLIDDPNCKNSLSFEPVSYNFTLDNKVGNHTIRIVSQYANTGSICAPYWTSDDQDDLTIYVQGDKSTIPMHSGTPFYTINQNPMYPNNLSCLQNMKDGDSCNITWTVNATGNVGEEYEFFAIYESDDGDVGGNETEKVNVKIIEKEQEEPQENLTEFNISLIKGWNLISSPLNFTNITKIFEPIKPYFGAMFGYDGEGQKFVNIDPYDANVEIDLVYGAWLNVSQDTTLSIVGEEVGNVNVGLFKGWNLIGYPSLNPSLVNETLKDINYSVVYGYNNSNWLSYVPVRNDNLNTLKYFIPGYGYWVNSREEKLLSFG